MGAERDGLCTLYLAFGYEYLIMAANSARTLRETGSRAHVKVITNVPVSDVRLHGRPLFDEIEYHDVPDAENRSFKTDLPPLTDHEFTLYLDADTEVYQPPENLVPLLGRFDVLMRTLPRPASKQYEVMPGVSTRESFYSEYNSGVIAFRRTAAAEAFFALWRDAYERMGRGADQPALLTAAFGDHPAAIGPLGATWNAKPTVDADLGLIWRRRREVAIVHYRDGFSYPPAGRNLARLQRRVDLVWTRRLPRVDEQIIDFEQRVRFYGIPLSNFRASRKLISIVAGATARIGGRDSHGLYKRRARTGRTFDQVDR